MDVVERGDITEAMRLIESSKWSVLQDESTPTSRSEKIYHAIREMSGKSREVEMPEAIDRCLTLGFSNDDIEEAIEEFELNNMWQVNANRTKIIFV